MAPLASWYWLAAVPMVPAPGGSWSAVIPADYTAAPYPPTYYFEPVHADGGRALYPGLGAALDQQPYFAVSPA